MGRSIFYREDYQASRVISEQVGTDSYHLLHMNENISVYYADPAMWGRQSTDTMITTVADIYRDNGLVLTKGDNCINGKRKIDNMLCMAPDGAPKLLIVDKRTNLIRQMQSLQRDPKNPEDVMKWN